MNGTKAALSSLERLNVFRESDKERDAMVEELVRNYKDLHTKYDEKSNDYHNEVESRRMWQLKATNAERQVVETRNTIESNAFVLAIIDGDGAIFQDYLYAMGKDGGADAATKLLSEIKQHVQATHPDTSTANWAVAVHVMLNLEGLAKKLHAIGVVVNPNELPAFGRAFGLNQPLFNFIDAGSGKERADHKVRETLRLFLPNAQCKHIYFAGCHDNGYLTTLDQFKRDASVASRITLLETTPAEPGFTRLGFQIVSFPSVFRSKPLPSSPVNGMLPPRVLSVASVNNFQPTPALPAPPAPPAYTPAPFTPTLPKSPSPTPSADSSWATIGRTGPSSSKIINIAAKKAPPRRACLLNAYDERLDADLPRADPGAEKRYGERIKERGKICNAFHLNGACDAAEYCDYHHGEKLSPGEQLVLKHKARSRSCLAKSYCRDPACIFGHVCKFGTHCYLDTCWFGDTHNMDMTPAKRVFEDGSEEWLPT